ncbi:MAG: poly-beta-1,6 N-acetyl-D-glucosamine synthase [Eubacterium sp.]|nr:poly-beta-1,6 N-acetyl-D-glucosamine synthase [Eubacterium sp.]
MNVLFKTIELFVFWYPAIMSVVWIAGGIIFYMCIERGNPLPLYKTPMVSILVPCFNEADTIENTVKRLSEMKYPNYEIIVINDGSSDNTSEIVTGLVDRYPNLRFIDLKENCGKANALYLGLIASKGEILLGVDSDSYVMPDALNYMVPHFTNRFNGERVGAVTGNPRVRNRSSLLAKIQLCEYSSIISLIKRTQRIWGKVMTVSGVVVAFRKRALVDAELWDRDMITEDIGVTWKLEKKFWDIRYEPRALCMMLVPETVKGLAKQRGRWTSGGMEILRRHNNIFTNWKERRLFPVYMEQLLSILWSICWLIMVNVILYHLIVDGNYIQMPYIWKSLFLSSVCLIQFSVAMLLDKKYDPHLLKHSVAAIWYPFFYWYINALLVIKSLPTLFKNNKKLAVWSSPDRGIGVNSELKETAKV